MLAGVEGKVSVCFAGQNRRLMGFNFCPNLAAFSHYQMCRF